MFQTSVAIRNLSLEAAAVAIGGGVLRIYDDSGSIPANPEDAIVGSQIICVVSLNATGAGISFETSASGGLIVKKTTETWRGIYIGNGNLLFYRYELLGDTQGADPTAIRFQGTIGLLNEDLNVSQMVRAIGEEQRVDSYVVGQPAHGS